MKITEIERLKQLAGLREFNDPQGQFTTTAAPDNSQDPKKGYAVRVIGKFGGPNGTFAAEDLWRSLETILPRDYPNADFQNQDREKTPQLRVLQTVARQGSAIVKTGIPSLDIAETIANKFNTYRGPIDPQRPIPAEVIELDR